MAPSALRPCSARRSRLYHNGDVDLPRLLQVLTANPARLLGLGSGRLAQARPPTSS